MGPLTFLEQPGHFLVAPGVSPLTAINKTSEEMMDRIDAEGADELRAAGASEGQVEAALARWRRQRREREEDDVDRSRGDQ